jgi:hypothetical protein
MTVRWQRKTERNEVIVKGKECQRSHVVLEVKSEGVWRNSVRISKDKVTARQPTLI